MAHDWIDLYLGGATLDEVSDFEMITKQGLVFRLRRLGIHVRSTAETHALRTRRLIAEEGTTVRELFLRTRSIQETAHEMNLSNSMVERAVDALVPDWKVLARSPRGEAKRYSNEELLQSLVEASQTTQVNLTTAAYRRFVEEFPLSENGRPRPGHQAMLLRFGSWGAALSSANLPANPPAGPP